MSTNQRDESVGGGGGAAASQQRVPLLRPEGDAPYSAWKPQITTYMMSVGIDARYYAKPVPGWLVLEAAVRAAAEADEDAALAALLGVGPPTKSEPIGTDATGSVTAPKLAPSVDAAKMALLTTMVKQSKRAFTILYAAIDADLRALISDVPQGYAYGLWSLLEERFQSVKHQNVADVWRRFTSLAQDAGEPYDAYMARVEKDTELLRLAKESVSPGLRMVVLLHNLQPMYGQARLALQTSGRLDDPAKIDWPAVKAFILDFERDNARVNAADGTGGANALAMAARTPAGTYKQALQSKMPTGAGAGDRSAHVKCFNCNQLGHYARKCTKPQKERRDNGGGRLGGRDGGGRKSPRASDDDESTPYESANSCEHVFALGASNRFASLSDDSYDSAVSIDSYEDTDDEVVYAASAVGPAAAAASAKKRADDAKAQEAEEKKKADNAKAKAIEREKALKAATVKENQEALELRRESLEAKKQRDTNPVDKALKQFDWGVDTMASVSITGNKALLTNVRRCTPIVVKVADGRSLSATHKGTTKLRLKPMGDKPAISIDVEDIYWHESFDANLLSWGKLRADGWKLLSTPDGTRVTTPRGTNVVASNDGRLMVLMTAKIAQRVYATRGGKCATADDLVRMHERFGHVGFARLLEMSRAGRTDGIGSVDGLSNVALAEAKKRVTECAACLQGKKPRAPFGERGLDSGQCPGDVLHVDTAHVKLPNDPAGRKVVRTWVVATDPFTEGRFSAVVDTKDQVASALIAIMARLQTMSGNRLRMLYCDNGSELVNRTVRDWCAANGTELRTPPANTPELRGIAERTVRSFKDGARTMLLHCGAPTSVWEYAANYQAYLWNRTRIAKRTNKTPLEALGGRTPSVLHTGVFGCDAWVHVSKADRGTFAPKWAPGVYLGHDDKQHGALVRILATGKVTRVRHVELREDSFEHMEALRLGRTSVPAYQRGHLSGSRALPAPASSAVTKTRGTNAHVRSPRTTGADGVTWTGIANSDSPYDADDDAPDARRHREGAQPSAAESKEDHESEVEYEVKKVLNSRTTPGGKQYLVCWEGYDKPTWEPAANLKGAPDVVAEYERTVRDDEARATKSSVHPMRVRSALKRAPVDEPSANAEPTASVSAVMQVLAALGDCSRL